MKKKLLLIIVALVLCGCSDGTPVDSVSARNPQPVTAVTLPTALTSAPPVFPVFDTSFFSGKPDTKQFGLQPMRIVDRGWESPDGFKNLPDEASFKNVMRKLELEDAVTPLVINIESWTFACKDANGVATGTPDKFETIIKWTREAAPKLKIGIYLVAPIRNYRDTLLPETDPKYIAWQQNNDCYQKVVDKLDFLLPSLYAFYPDSDPKRGQEFVNGWVKYATANLKEARRLAKGKPVYPFLWMQYHSSNSEGYAHKLISGSFWKLQLETVKKLSDGVVLWGTIKTNTETLFEPMPWDENSEWWLETQKFVSALSK